jgi:hypothetical protein
VIAIENNSLLMYEVFQRFPDCRWLINIANEQSSPTSTPQATLSTPSTPTPQPKVKYRSVSVAKALAQNPSGSFTTSTSLTSKLSDKVKKFSSWSKKRNSFKSKLLEHEEENLLLQTDRPKVSSTESDEDQSKPVIISPELVSLEIE